MKKAIKAENISKQYRLGEVGTGTLSHDLNRWIYKILGKENPYLKIGESNDRSKKGDSDYVWSLKDINFEINKGEAVGIIGKNGAGKSTLLKLLSKVTKPTTGKFYLHGRIASLLEVGTGFNPEMTGRENVFLNGAILGMSRNEIKRKFDEIVDFAGVERYIDTPVKRYSSGMYVRLAFAVAAYLESEILIVDEVLAVGDAEFQKKCIGKMGDISKGEGRTVLFVSHNMSAVRDLCTSGLLLDKGKVIYNGSIDETISKYLEEPAHIKSNDDLLSDTKSRRGNGEVRFSNITINDGQNILDPTEDTFIKFTADVLKDVESIRFSLLIFGPYDNTSITNANLISISDSKVEANTKINFELLIPKNTFRTGIFPLYFWLGKKAEMAEEHYPFDVIDRIFNLNYSTQKQGLSYNPLNPNGLFNIDYKILKHELL